MKKLFHVGKNHSVPSFLGEGGKNTKGSKTEAIENGKTDKNSELYVSDELSMPEPLEGRRRMPKPFVSQDVAPGQGGLIKDPMKNDVLSGRGGRINSHEGNVIFRGLVNQTKHLYLSKETRKLEKAAVADGIVLKIRRLNPPGRFLKLHDGGSGSWLEIGDEKARKKAGQAMRENAEETRKEMEVDEGQANLPIGGCFSSISRQLKPSHILPTRDTRPLLEPHLNSSSNPHSNHNPYSNSHPNHNPYSNLHSNPNPNHNPNTNLSTNLNPNQSRPFKNAQPTANNIQSWQSGGPLLHPPLNIQSSKLLPTNCRPLPSNPTPFHSYNDMAQEQLYPSLSNGSDMQQTSYEHHQHPPPPPQSRTNLRQKMFQHNQAPSSTLCKDNAFGKEFNPLPLPPRGVSRGISCSSIGLQGPLGSSVNNLDLPQKVVSTSFRRPSKQLSMEMSFSSLIRSNSFPNIKSFSTNFGSSQVISEHFEQDFSQVPFPTPSNADVFQHPVPDTQHSQEQQKDHIGEGSASSQESAMDSDAIASRSISAISGVSLTKPLRPRRGSSSTTTSSDKMINGVDEFRVDIGNLKNLYAEKGHRGSMMSDSISEMSLELEGLDLAASSMNCTVWSQNIDYPSPLGKLY